MDDLNQYNPIRWEDLSRNLDYDYLEHERRDKLALDARISGPGRPKAWRHGKGCPCDSCKRDRALKAALRAFDERANKVRAGE